MNIISFAGVICGTVVYVVSGLSSMTLDTTKIVEDKFDYYDSENMRKASWSNGENFDCDWSEDNVIFDSGIMNLKLTKKNTSSNYQYDYSGAEYRTKNTFGYGLYLVKMKPAKNDGIVSSFFAYTGPSQGTVWDEIDIEFLGKDTSQVQFNFFSNGQGNHEYIYDLGFDASDAFHEYGFLWTSEEITWFVDGKTVYSVSSKYNELPVTDCKIMMNIWNGKDNEKMNSWLNKYNGNVDLVASYDYFKYYPLDAISYQTSYDTNISVNKNEMIETEKTDDNVVENNKTVDLTNKWKSIFSQYTIKMKQGKMQIASSIDNYAEGSFIYSSIDGGIINPKELNIDYTIQNGYICSFTPVLVDENNKEIVLKNTTIINNKGNHIINLKLDKSYGKIKAVRIYYNSQLKYINELKNSYSIIIMNDCTISN